MATELKILGNLQISFDSVELELSPNHAVLLLSYLAYQADWVNRDYLLALLWPDAAEPKARQSLRALLYKCKKYDWVQGLEQDTKRLRWLIETDVAKFQAALSHGKWHSAVNYHRGAFLATYRGGISIPFDDWTDQTRGELAAAWRDAAMHDASDLIGQGKNNEAIKLLQDVLDYDNLAEDCVQLMMQVQAAAGHKSAALTTFASFSKQLAIELDMEPLETTLELAERISQNSFPLKSSQKTPYVTALSQRTSSLPEPQTAFIGRTLELLEIGNLLSKRDNRLITLLGPGGIGKSRLALQVLKERQDRYQDGVAFIPLAPLNQAGDIPDTVASTLNLDLSGKTSVEEEIFAYLHDKNILLVLDNYEHLLQGRTFVQELLEHTASCQIICTSRALLELPNELAYDVVGLGLPNQVDTQLETYDAVKLFIRSARRSQASFKLEPQDYPSLMELCNNLEGMPLALELAAVWVRLFSLPELVQELKKDINLLETSGKQVSERHRSMRHVFMTSWSLLNNEEKKVLAALSVFRGGVEFEAARQVTQASPRILLALMNRSLLQRTASGRFTILEVIRQFVSEHLVDTLQFEDSHMRYYFNYLLELDFRIAPKDHLRAADDDLENIRKAWRTSLSQHRFEAFVEVTGKLTLYFDIRSTLREGIMLLEEAVCELETETGHSHLVGSALINQAQLYEGIGDIKSVDSLSRRGIELLANSETSQNPSTIRDHVVGLLLQSACAKEYGDKQRALSMLTQAEELAKSSGNVGLQLTVLKENALVEQKFGDFMKAERLYTEALEAYEKTADHLGIMEVFSHWGVMKVHQGHIKEAQIMLQKALFLAESIEDQGYPSASYGYLGACELQLGNLSEAATYLKRAIQLAKRSDNQTEQIEFMTIYAETKLRQGDPSAARTLLYKSLSLAWEIQNVSSVLDSLLAWTSYCLSKADTETTQRVLEAVLKHKNTSFVTRQKARSMVSQLALESTPPISDKGTVILQPLVEHFLDTRQQCQPPYKT